MFGFNLNKLKIESRFSFLYVFSISLIVLIGLLTLLVFQINNPNTALVFIDSLTLLNIQELLAYNTLILVLFVLYILVLITSLFAFFMLRKTIIKPIKNINEILNLVSKGEIVNVSISNKSNDEISEIKQSIQNTVKGIKLKSEAIKTMSSGNFELEIAQQSKKDKLGKALLEMRNNLLNKKTVEENKLSELELQIQNLKKQITIPSNTNQVSSSDIKNPLHSIQLISAWISKEMSEAKSIENKKQYSMLQSRIQQIEFLIGSIIKYNASSNSNNIKELVSTKQIVIDVLKRLDPMKNFSIYHDDTLPKITANYKEITDIFTELICNSIRYNQSEKAEINITYKTENQNYIFCVSDNGPGISQEIKNKFLDTIEPKNKNENGEKSGLYLTKKAIEENGGKMCLDSEENNGTKIYFTWEIPMLKS